MSKQQFNRVQVRFNAEHKPYLYGMIHIVDGDLANQWWGKPFVISKRTADGREIVYGTVARTMENARSQLDRLEAFGSDAQKRLDAAGIGPFEGTVWQLPPCEITDRILDEQDTLVEEVLLIVSVNVRVLSEIFPSKMKKAKVTVYDYDGACIDNIELSRIADLLLHNRYIMIRDQYVVDLISDEKFLSDRPQLGLKIDFDEYLGEVRRALEDLTVNDLIGRAAERDETVVVIIERQGHCLSHTESLHAGRTRYDGRHPRRRRPTQVDTGQSGGADSGRGSKSRSR